MKKYSILVITAISFIAFCLLNGSFAQKQSSVQLKLDNMTVDLDVADTPKVRALGLMYKESMPYDHGMLFLFENPRVVKFWMKNVYFPLDMVFISENKIVKIIRKVPPCNRVDCPIYSSEQVVDSVIELNAGFCAKNGFEVGQVLSINHDYLGKSLE